MENRDIRLALLGDHEAAKRLTEEGDLLPLVMERVEALHENRD